MSFARALVAAGPSARLAAGRVAAPRSLALAYRWHSTAPRHQQLDPTVSNKPRDHLQPPPIRSPSSKTARFTAADEPGKDYDPYKDGPSAIDKAVHLFFFTEIIRGACRLQMPFNGRTAKLRRQACGWCWSNSSDRPTLSCTHTRRALFPLASVESMLCVDTLAVKSAALVRCSRVLDKWQS